MALAKLHTFLRLHCGSVYTWICLIISVYSFARQQVQPDCSRFIRAV